MLNNIDKIRALFGELNLEDGSGPIYLRLFDAIVLLIESKKLADGDRLPPLRDLAQILGVNVSTVSRALKMLQQRGHVESRVGSGSYVRPPRPSPPRSGVVETAGLCDLSINRPATDAYLHALERLLPMLPEHDRFSMIQDYHVPEGDLRVRTAFASWLAPALGHHDPDRLVMVNGCQHGMSCILDTITRPGDVVLADRITFHGFISLCASKAIRLKSVETDQAGMVPEAFRDACIQHRPKAVFLMPNNHNPTTVVLSPRRRQALANIAREHGVYVIEDDVCGPLLETPPPTIASTHPDITFYVTSLSKCVAAGTRLGGGLGPTHDACQPRRNVATELLEYELLDELHRRDADRTEDHGRDRRDGTGRTARPQQDPQRDPALFPDAPLGYIALCLDRTARAMALHDIRQERRAGRGRLVVRGGIQFLAVTPACRAHQHQRRALWPGAAEGHDHIA